ncbi:UNVERIFIED_CONTAM: ABC-type multidrug transport system permease subunit [Acetivibrio alkalicellulosi]
MIISLNIAINYFRRIIREPMAIFFLLIFPIIGSVLGVMLVSFYDKVEVGINYNLPDDHRLNVIFNDIDKFNLTYHSTDSIEEKIRSNELDIGIILPEDFEQRIFENFKTDVKIISLKNHSTVIHVRMIMEEYIRSAILNSEISDVQALRNAANNISGPRLSLGFMFMSILVFVGIIMELVLEDKKKKTFTRIFCAPIKNYEFIVGTLLSVLFLGTLKVFIFLLIARFGLGFDWKVPMGNTFIVLFFFLISAVGINLGLVGLVRNTSLYLASNVLVSIFTSFIGGSFYSASFMGEYGERFSNFFPQKWAMSAYEKLVDGNSLNSISSHMLILVLFGVVFASIGISSINPSESDL